MTTQATAQSSFASPSKKLSALRTFLGVLWPAKIAPRQKGKSAQQAAVPDAEAATPVDPVQTIDDPDLRHMTDTLLFQQSATAAKDLLNNARSLRQERIFQKGAAEHAVYRCQRQQGYYESNLEYKEATQAQMGIKLQHRWRELDEATQRLARADRDFGLVSGVMEEAGYPPFPLDTHVPAPFPITDVDSDGPDELPDDLSNSPSCEE